MDNSTGIGIRFVLVQHYELIIVENKNEYSDLLVIKTGSELANC